MAEKKCPECPPKGAPAYMTTFGDMMTLLLTFFVLLLSFSDTHEAKFRRAVGSLQGALGVLPYEQSIIVPQEIPIPQLTNLQEAEIQETLEELQDVSADLDISEMIKLEITEEGIHITLTDSLLFDPSDARLKPGIPPILRAIADLARGWSNTVMIAGHTDSDPINTPQYPSNWHLSFARAMAVHNFFAEIAGLDESKLMPMAFGEFQNLEPNDTRENKQKNRRVEIFIQHDVEGVRPPAKVKSYIEKLRRIK